jgi:carboxymethylenebutenolidase
MPQVTIPGGASTPALTAHLAAPPVAAPPWPGVVVLHESFGLNDDIRQQADRLAAAGYLAVALDLYSAGGAWRCIRATFRALMAGEGKPFDDIDVTRRWLAERPDCTGRVGVIGFCMGGGFAILTAARGFAASAPNYAHLPDDLDDVLRGACPMVASYGAKDRTLRGTAAELEAALTRAGVEHDVVEYPGAGHSFLNRHDLGPAGALLRVGGIG